jgi:hypothetical protein
MALAGRQPAGDGLSATGEVDELDAVPAAIDGLPVAAFERRAGNDSVLAGVETLVDPVGDKREPGPAVFVGEGMTGCHLVDVGLRVQCIALFEWPAECAGEQCGNGGFSAP